MNRITFALWPSLSCSCAAEKHSAIVRPLRGIDEEEIMKAGTVTDEHGMQVR